METSCAYALSENFAVFMGKFDTLDGDQNAFAHGRGITQFSNLAMVINPVAVSGSPYSTLGAGFAVLQDREPIFVFTLMNATDTTRTVGFDELFSEGVLLSAGLRLPTNFFGLPGHQSFSGLWNSREYTELVSDPRASAGFDASQTVFPLNKPVNGNYALLYNFDQYLAVDKHGRGWGLFGRAGLGDQRVNPLAYFLSAGIGGNNIWSRNRRNDSFGIGWYYLGATENASLLDALDDVKLKDGQGMEMYYDFAVCSFANLTLDYQWIQAPSSLADVSNPASILGFRFNILL
jgi:porin